MSEERNKLAELFAACWKDEALKARFMTDPKAVLAEHGIDVPDGIDVNVVENSDNTAHIIMPAAPPGAAGLSDEELSNAAGGCSNEYDSMAACISACGAH
ncbi:MAG: NHLP leader peptide family RiPP precursor [Planctomycetota bacterium]|nr:NHLP leader peptide family RiPP precursor [Planctomycetota bacterium]